MYEVIFICFYIYKWLSLYLIINGQLHFYVMNCKNAYANINRLIIIIIIIVIVINGIFHYIS